MVSQANQPSRLLSTSSYQAEGPENRAWHLETPCRVFVLIGLREADRLVFANIFRKLK